MTSTNENEKSEKIKKEDDEKDNDHESDDMDENAEENKKTKKKSEEEDWQRRIETSRAEFVLAHMCMQPDFNGNTVIHLAAQSSSLDVLRQINPVCVRNSLYIYNDEGLNTFLIACRYGSLKFMRYFVEHCVDDAGLVGKLMRDSRDQANIKNCLHFACGRGCGKSCLQVVGYLTRLAASLQQQQQQQNNASEHNSPVNFF